MFKFIAAAALALGLITTPAHAQDDFLASLFGRPITKQTESHPALARIQARFDAARHHRKTARTNPRDEAAMAEADAHVAQGNDAEVRTAYTAGRVHGMAAQIARQNGVSVALVRAVLHVESTGRCSASSRAGAMGAMQVKRATAASVGVHGNLHDCRTGIVAGVRYLKQALAVNHGNVCAAASSYNTGLGVRGRCSGYGRKVVATMNRLRYASL
jgi:soluble lytic murein transglycosylase-like protein